MSVQMIPTGNVSHDEWLKAGDVWSVEKISSFRAAWYSRRNKALEADRPEIEPCSISY